MGARAAGDVDLIDPLVPSEVLTHLGAAVREADEAIGDEVAKDVLEDGAEILVDRVHLEQADVTFRVQLVEHIKGGDARDVARAQHQHQRTLRLRLLVEDGHGVGEAGRGDTGLHPHLRADTAEQQPIPGALREHVDHHLAVRTGVHCVATQAG